MEIWSFEAMQCLNFNMQRQKCHDVTNDVKFDFMIARFIGCMENMAFLAIILF